MNRVLVVVALALIHSAGSAAPAAAQTTSYQYVGGPNAGFCDADEFASACRVRVRSGATQVELSAKDVAVPHIGFTVYFCSADATACTSPLTFCDESPRLSIPSDKPLIQVVLHDWPVPRDCGLIGRPTVGTLTVTQT